MNKNIKFFFNYGVVPLLFAFLLYSIYRQIQQQPGLATSWSAVRAAFGSSRLLLLAGAVLLVPCNWGIEALKWRFALHGVHPVSLSTAFRAVLSGVAFSVSLPNRIGEYLGRILYLPSGGRLRTIPATLVGSVSQLLVTLVAGLAALPVLRPEVLARYPALGAFWTPFSLGGAGVTGVLLLLYFRAGALPRLGEAGWVGRRYRYLLRSLRNFNVQRLSLLLLLSFCRYAVFLLQYVLLFRFFGLETGTGILVAVTALTFLVLAVVPSIALIEVGLRGEIGLRLLGLYSANSLGIALTSVTVWALNLLLPALAGTLLILNLKVFRKE